MAQTIKLKRSAIAGRVPTTSDLALGEVAINTVDGKMYIKKDVGGTESIVEIGSGAVSSSFLLHEYSVTTSQTVFSGSDDNSNTLAYDTGAPPRIQVFLNGVLLDYSTDYTATDGTSITLTVAATSGDLIQIAAYKSVTVDSNISLSDNTKILLGNDDDLEIYHDGSNSIINDAGTGNLQLQVGGTTVVETSASGLTVTGEVNTDTIQFDTTATGATSIGEVAWNTDTGTLELGLSANVNLEVGEQTYINVKAAEAISIGDVVYASGAIGNSSKIEVSKYIANGTIEERRVVGIAAEDITIGNFGYISTFGSIRGLSTDGSNLTTPETWNVGDILYASPNVAGELTKTLPTSPHQAIAIAFVTSAHATNGSLMVRAYDLGYHLDELHDVEISSVADNDIIQWSSANSRWENVAGTTSNIAEGTNLYYTDARVSTYLTANSYATESYVSTAVSNLVDSAPATLDTLNELAAALGDDPNFATTVSTSIGTKWTQDNTKISNWDTAYSWGDHAAAGYVTSVSVDGGSAASVYLSAQSIDGGSA